MRLTLCAALLLLAGCTGPDAGDPALGPVDSAPALVPAAEAAGVDPLAVVVARFNTTYANYTGAFDIALAGQHAATWDAGGALGLPRPMGSLLFEMRCQKTGGTVEDDPGYALTFHVEDGDRTYITYAASDIDACQGRREYDRADVYGAGGELSAVEIRTSDGWFSLNASYEVAFAITWFDAERVPAGYSAFA